MRRRARPDPAVTSQSGRLFAVGCTCEAGDHGFRNPDSGPPGFHDGMCLQAVDTLFPDRLDILARPGTLARFRCLLVPQDWILVPGDRGVPAAGLR